MKLRALLALFVGASFALVARPSSANPGINGYSGKPYFGSSQTCETTCHRPTSPRPVLNITVPQSVRAGAINEVTVVVDGTRARTSFNAAFSNGVKAIKGQNTEVPFPVETPEEVVAVVPPPSGADGTYKFSFVAPLTNGTVTLWIAGMSASGSGTGGDGVAVATRTITVTGGTQPGADAGTGSGGNDGGTSGPGDGGSSSGGSSSSSGSASGSGGGSSEPDPSRTGDDEPSASARRGGGSDDGGCATSRARRSAGGGSLAVVLAASLLALARRQRRFRRAARR